MSVCFIPPAYTAILHSNTGVYRGIHYFLIFALKHILSVLIEAVLTCTHNIYFEQKYEKSKKIKTENCHLYSREILQYIVWACFRNENGGDGEV